MTAFGSRSATRARRAAGRGDGRGRATSTAAPGGRRSRTVPTGARGRVAAWLLDVHGAGRRPRGHGLRVAADAAARHGGRLLVVRDGGGTAAILELPLGPPGAHRPVRGAPPAAPGPSPAGAPAADAGVSPRRRAVLLGGLALTLGALAASDVAGREAALRRDLGTPVAVVVARRELRAGARIAARDLAVRRLPARYAPAGAVGDPRQVAGLRPATDVPAGADLDAALLGDGATSPPPGAPVRPGERLAQLDVSGAADGVGPGARVDVLVTRDGRGDASGRTVLALEDVEVVGAAPAGGLPARRARSSP